MPLRPVASAPATPTSASAWPKPQTEANHQWNCRKRWARRTRCSGHPLDVRGGLHGDRSIRRHLVVPDERERCASVATPPRPARLGWRCPQHASTPSLWSDRRDGKLVPPRLSDSGSRARTTIAHLHHLGPALSRSIALRLESLDHAPGRGRMDDARGRSPGFAAARQTF